MPACNNTLEQEVINELPLWKGFDFHHFGLFLAAVFGGIAVVLSLYLIAMHALHYQQPWEQRHIIRIVLLVPIYAVVSFLSYVYYRHALYYDVLEGCYEAFAISSFFTLLCYYIAPNLHDQKEYFRGLKPKNWFWKFNGLQYICGKSFGLAMRGRWREAAEYGEMYGPFRKPRSGLTWFNIIWTGVFQYCVIRVLFTIVAVITEAFDLYCEDSLSPAFAHVWVEVFEAVSVTIAMFCLIQFYIQLREDLAEHKPFLKILCIKLVIFFSFWQTILISFLSSANGPLRPNKYVGYQDIKVGIPAMLLCIEMAIFSVMYLFAFPWKTYSIKHSYDNPLSASGNGFSGEAPRYRGGPLGILALADAFNPWDTLKAIGRGFKFVLVGYKQREQDPSYQRTSTKPPGATGYTGPLYAGNNEPATELRSSEELEHKGFVATSKADHSDDRAGLLANPSQMAQGSGASSRGDEDEDDASATDRPRPSDSGEPIPYHHALTTPSGPYDHAVFDEQDTSYHPGFGPGYAPSGPEGNAPRAAPYRGATASPLHPALRNGGGGSSNGGGAIEGANAAWNFFAGATSDDPQAGHPHNVEELPPPQYASRNARGT